MPSKDLKYSVEQHIGSSIEHFQSVSGGSINQAAQITAQDGQSYFLKWNSTAASDMFPKEEKGLQLLRSAESGLRIPDIIGSGSTDSGTDFLVMEYIMEGTARSDSAETFGRQLAALHQQMEEQFGLDHDNYIGKLPQANAWHRNWVDFFIEQRLQPQLQQAIESRKLSDQVETHFQNLYKELPDMLTDEPASLLHGDLWSGNYFYDTDGNPVIYDPAAYYGNREIELAFTHLFGGFSTAFYDAYDGVFPVQPGFSERKDIYNLYPLLVHTNLFGGSYARQVQSIVQQFA